MIALIEKGEREPSFKMLRVWGDETGQSAIIGLVSGAYIGHDDTGGLMQVIEENVRMRVATQIMQGA
jgi:hypothetical protein